MSIPASQYIPSPAPVVVVFFFFLKQLESLSDTSFQREHFSHFYKIEEEDNKSCVNFLYKCITLKVLVIKKSLSYLVSAFNFLSEFLQSVRLLSRVQHFETSWTNSTAICKASSDGHFAFLHFIFLGMVLITTYCTMSRTSVHSSSGTLSIRSSPLNLFLTSTV